MSAFNLDRISLETFYPLGYKVNMLKATKRKRGQPKHEKEVGITKKKTSIKFTKKPKKIEAKEQPSVEE